jgi:hypothetical protein
MSLAPLRQPPSLRLKESAAQRRARHRLTAVEHRSKNISIPHLVNALHRLLLATTPVSAASEPPGCARLKPSPWRRPDAACHLFAWPPRSVIKHHALPVSATARAPPHGLSTFGQVWCHLILREPHGHPTDFSDQADGRLDHSFTPSWSPHSSSHRGRHLTADGASLAGSTPRSPPQGPRWHRAALQPIQLPLYHRSGLPSLSPPTDRALPWSANHGEPFPPLSVKMGSPHRRLPL